MHPLAHRLARAGIGVVAACVALTAAPGLPAFAASPTPLPHPVGGYIDSGAHLSASTANQRTGLVRPAALPSTVDLRASAPPVGDQGQVGSCVAWTVGYELMGYYAKTSGGTGAPYAPLYLYMRVVAPGGAPNAGLVPEWALSYAQNSGVDTQADYTQGTTNWTVAPTSAEIANASNYTVTGWSTLWSGSNQGVSAQTAMETALAAGNPVGIAFPVFMDFEYMAPNTLYNTLSGTSLGGHMVSVFAYDSQGVWIRNHWGTNWGTSGDAHLSWAFVEQVVQGAWTISGVHTPTTNPVVAPKVTSVSPTSGSTAGGTQVTISGTALAGATGVSFGDTAATFTTTGTGTTTQLVATAPAHAAGIVDVKVTNAAGTSTVVAGDRFTYKLPPPAVTSLDVTSASTLGGTKVTLTGTGLAHVTLVKVGTTAATGVKVLGDTSLQFVAPVHVAGTVDVTATAATGTSATSQADQLTYVAPPAPTITSLDPATGPTYKATVVTLTGTGLGKITKANLGTTTLAVTHVSDTQVKITVPVHVAGDMPITVTGPAGTSLASTFTYVAPPVPQVASLSPNTGATNQATTVTITGTGLNLATRVLLGTVPVAFTVQADGSLVAKVPPHAAGTVDLRVITPGGTSAPGTSYVYVAPPKPSVSGLDHSLGLTTSAATVLVNGANFTGVTRVTSGGIPVPFVVVSATQLRVTLPAHAATTVDVLVTTTAGTSEASVSDRFTYVTKLPGTSATRAI